MRSKDRNLIIVGFLICLFIAVLAPFIASNNPDGLEKSAQQISTAEEGGVYTAPFSDYLIPLLGESPLSGIVALIVGVLIALGLGYIAALVIRRKNPPKTSK
ncbi:MAG: PDGLE domain-containing protein [Methanobacterium sp.]